MRFHTLRMKNFGRHASLDIEFGPRMNVILGPNGCGKSTAMAALRYLTTGDSGLPGTSRNRILSGKDYCQVDLEFSHRGQTGHIKRTITAPAKSDARLVYGDHTFTGAREVNSRLLELLGSPLAYIQNYAFVGQKKIDAWFDKTPAERSAEFGRLLDLGRFEKAYQEAGRALTSVRLPDDRTQEIARQRDRLAKAEAEVDRLEAEIEEVRDQAAATEARIKEVASTLSRLKDRLAEWDEYARQQQAVLARESARKRLWAEFLSRAPVPSGPRPGPGVPEEVRATLQDIRTEIRDSVREKERVEALLKKGTCPTCGTPLTAQHLRHEEDDDLSIDELRELEAGLVLEIQTLTDQQKAWDARDESVQGLREKVRHEREVLQAVGVTQKPETPRPELEAAEAQARETHHNLLRSFPDIKQLESRLANARNLETEAASDLDELLAKQEEYQRISRGRERLERVRSLLHRDAAPARILKSKLEALYHAMPRALNAFEAPFSVEPSTEGLGFICHFADDRGSQKDTIISGGERVVLSWALRLAMDEAVAGGELGFMGFDEPTAGLDQYNLSRMPLVLESLRDVADARDLQILFVTHEKAIADLCDTVIDLT